MPVRTALSPRLLVENDPRSEQARKSLIRSTRCSLPAELRHRDALYHQVEQTGKAQRAVHTLRHIAAAGRQAIDPKGGRYLVDKPEAGRQAALAVGALFSHRVQGGGIWPDGPGMPDHQPQALRPTKPAPEPTNGRQP
jgi:hypothetical protein